MVETVRVEVKDHGTFTYLKKLPDRADKIGNREAWNLTQFGAKAMIQSAINARIRSWRGNLLKYGTGITPSKIGKGRYAIKMPWYGQRLDEMPDHAVALKPGRTITQWVREKKPGFQGRYITVHRHPFTQAAYGRMLNQLERIVAKRIANKIAR